MKKPITLVIFFIFLTSSLVFAVSFSDTSSHKYKDAIEYIAEKGIVEGYEDGSYRPDANINRAELLKIILESNNIDVSDNLNNCFPDVRDDWYAKYVCKAQELGIIDGYPDGTFKPANNINFVEAIKIVELGYGAQLEDSNPWYQTYVDEADSKNMIPNDINSMDELITRGQMADIITRLLTYQEGTQDDYLSTISDTVNSVIVDTNQTTCYNDFNSITCPSVGANFYGQDANYSGNQPSYIDNGNGTVSDLNTGLMWQQDPGEKVSYSQAVDTLESFELAGYDDWRLPTIKELYSLMDFSGKDISGYEGNTENLEPFIDNDYFNFYYGDSSAGQRIIDSQWITSNIYESTVMGGSECFFGVNFADGRIKCYPTMGGRSGGYYLIYVRGNSYGVNEFVDNSDGTITDGSSTLMWQKEDSGVGMDWESALGYCEDLELAGYDNWRLPDAKELQYLVDYSRSPDTTNSAAIDPVFEVSDIINEAGDLDFPFYWSGTTHANMMAGDHAAYVAFGRALGYMLEFGGWIDVHGAGAQRSDPKSGDAEDYPYGHGPQGDAIRIENYVRCVR
ncbi:DUF1566 domain-containing protein [Patescibacteria group bacterium]